MDPNEALANARRAADVHDKATTLEREAEAGAALVEAFNALDQWLSNGGFLPADWAAKR